MTGRPGRTNWTQVAVAALAQNVATGLAFGSFGSFVLAIEAEFGANRAMSSLAVSLMVLTLSLTASLLGRLIDRVSVRTIMMVGAAAGTMAYAALAVSHGVLALVLIYALVLGPATAALGVLPSMTLAARWTDAEHRGRALGLVNMPVLVMAVPLIMGSLLPTQGLRFCYGVLALGQVLMLPVLLLVRDRNPDAAPSAETAPPQPSFRASTIFTQPAFWTMTVAVGLIAGAGTMKLAHFVPLLTEQGRTFNEANLLLALSGGSGLLGSLAFGALADRIGGVRTLIVNAALQAVLWTIFLAPVGMPLLIVDAIVVGACGGGLQAAIGVVVVALFGLPNFSRVYGLLTLATVPFLFGLTPLASILYQRSGNYHLPMGMMIGGFVVAAILLSSLIERERRTRLIASSV